MVFSIISLIISVAVIFLVRQYDKKQSSLAKTKRYVEQLNAEFEAHYAQRSKELRTLSDELRSETAQSIATVKRLEELSQNYQSSCNDIAEKHSVIMQLTESISDANKKFQQIVDMSGLVDANVKQIKDDAKFVDAVSNNLKKAHNELEAVQHDVANMRETFKTENDRTLEEAKQNIIRTLSTQLETINDKLAATQKDTDALLDVTRIKLKDIYKKALDEAARSANELEGEAFETLKADSAARVANYKRELDENITATHALSERFKSAWQDEASGMLAKMQNDFTETESRLNENLDRLDKRLNNLESDILLKTKSVDDAVAESEKVFNAKIAAGVANLNGKITELSEYTEKQLATVKEQTEYRLSKFDATVSEFQNSEATLKTLLASVKQNIIAAFEGYKYENNKKLAAFSEDFMQQASGVSEKIAEIENKVEELKAKSYENVSEKLKVFEDSFFTDITAKKNDLENMLENVQNEIVDKLQALSSEQESARKNLEEQYTDELKNRLLEIANSHKEKLANFDKQIKDIENNLTERLSAQNVNIENVTEMLKSHVAEAKEHAKLDMKNELDAYMTSLQNNISNSNRDMDETSKKIADNIAGFAQEYQIKMDTANSNFQSWKGSLDKQFDSARNLFNDKISSFTQLAEAAISDFEKRHDTDVNNFKKENSAAFEKIKVELDNVSKKLEAHKTEIVSFSQQVKNELDVQAAELSASFDKNMQEKIDGTTNQMHLISDNLESLKGQIEKNRSEAFSVIQSESMRLTSTMQSLNEKQNEYLSNTKLFERTDELKAELDKNIKTLQSELAKLSVYEASLDDVKLKYDKFSHQNEETLNKIENFMQEKSKVELLEQEFTKLAGLSESIERKQLELEASNDEMQKYQIQIRKLDDSINAVNTKYATLDEKSDVLNQTIKDIDKAFSNLNSIDIQFKESKKSLENLNPEISKLRSEMDNLIKNRSEINEIIEKIKALDNMQNDVEERMQTLQNSKEWLAGVESRLNDLDDTVTQRIKLFATVYNADEKKPRAPNTTLTLAERHNIIDLHHMDWTNQQIADAMKCTISEVELILEMSDKYEDID